MGSFFSENCARFLDLVISLDWPLIGFYCSLLDRTSHHFYCVSSSLILSLYYSFSILLLWFTSLSLSFFLIFIPNHLYSPSIHPSLSLSQYLGTSATFCFSLLLSLSLSLSLSLYHTLCGFPSLYFSFLLWNDIAFTRGSTVLFDQSQTETSQVCVSHSLNWILSNLTGFTRGLKLFGGNWFMPGIRLWSPTPGEPAAEREKKTKQRAYEID